MTSRSGTRRARPLVFITAAGALMAVLLTSTIPATGTVASTSVVSTPEALGFRNEMRRLWVEHVTWTRLFIVSFDANLPDLGPTTQRLLRNQEDIGNLVRPIYGDAAADRLTQLLKQHIRQAAALVAAAKSGDTERFQQVKEAWYANARRIARFLHSANPENWPLDELRLMMRMHLDLTLAEAADYLAGRYLASIRDFDRVEAEILRMADFLSIGIIKQFPSRFV
jgi:hypothetical protein